MLGLSYVCQICVLLAYLTGKIMYLVVAKLSAKQKHLGHKNERPIRSNIANRQVQPKTLISAEAKKLLYQNI